MNFHFVTVVWGDSYTDLFLNVALPNQLSSGNLGTFPGRNGSVYKIYTMSTDAERIKNSLVFSKLSKIISTEIALIDDVKTGIALMDDVKIDAKYNALIEALLECHRRAIREAESDAAILIFLSPDSIWSDGTFANLARLAAAGKRAVMVAGLRLVKETFVPVFLERYYSKDDLTASISSRELVKLALEHLHPITKSLFWDSTEFSRWPSHLYWHIGQEGLLARCFQLHPLMVNPLRKGILPSLAIDDDYTLLAVPNPDDLYVVADSDEIVGCEISSLSQNVGEIAPNSSSIIEVATRAKYRADLYHSEFVRHKIRLHCGEISENWQKVEHHSDKVVDTICRLVKIPMVFYNLRMAFRRLNKMTLPFVIRRLREKGIIYCFKAAGRLFARP